MSLNKAVEYGKEHRKPYRGAKAFDSFCRNHGECAYCTGNRLYQLRKNEENANWKCKNWWNLLKLASRNGERY